LALSTLLSTPPQALKSDISTDVDGDASKRRELPILPDTANKVVETTKEGERPD
jgi:hypothetical protein